MAELRDMSPDAFEGAGVVLHVGLSKTATSSLQIMLHTSRDALGKIGIYYDDHVLSNRDPQHGWLTPALKGQREEVIVGPSRRFGGHRRILLSTEQVSQAFDKFDPADMARVSAVLGSYGPLRLLMVTRELGPWLKSYYKQYVCNLSRPPNPLPGTSMLFREFRQTPMVMRRLRHDDIAAALSDGFRAPIVRARYEDWPPEALYRALTGTAPPEAQAASGRRNKGQDDTHVEILRQMNSLTDSNRERCAWSRLLVKCFGADSTILRGQAKGVDDTAVAALSMDKLQRLEFVENPPLDVTPQGFEDAKSTLVAMLDRMGRDAARTGHAATAARLHR